MENACGYVRVSSEQQAEAEKGSLSDQKESIQKCADNQGLKIVRWYEDHESGQPLTGLPSISLWKMPGKENFPR